MICLTRLNDKKHWINPHQIERMESNPDTTLLMLSGQSFIVKESPEQVVDAIIAYRRRIGCFSNED